MLRRAADLLRVNGPFARRIERRKTFHLQVAKIQDSLKDAVQQAERAARGPAVLPSTVVAIFVATSEAFTEVVLIVSQTDIVTAITKRRILISKCIVVTEPPAILAIRLTGSNALFVAVSKCLP